MTHGILGNVSRVMNLQNAELHVTAMRLFHFSDDPAISRFVPRPVRMPSQRAPGMDWLNGPLVWAIEERLDFMYLFPRDCPRILIWATEQTTRADRMRWLGDRRAAAYIERERFGELAAAAIHRYDLPTESFEDLHGAGMWVSRVVVTPLRRDPLVDLPSTFAARGVDLRVVDSLLPLKPLWETTLHVSGIRLRNAKHLVSRETPSPHPGGVFPARLTAQVGGQNAKRGRRQAVEPGRLPYRPRPRPFQPVARLVRQPRHRTIVDPGQHQSLVAAERLDIGHLALEIDVIPGVDLDMGGNGWVNGRQFRPDAADFAPADLRIGQ